MSLTGLDIALQYNCKLFRKVQLMQDCCLAHFGVDYRSEINDGTLGDIEDSLSTWYGCRNPKVMQYRDISLRYAFALFCLMLLCWAGTIFKVVGLEA